MKIEYSKDAMKFLTRTDKPTRQRIISAIDGLTQLPPVGDIKTLQGFDDGSQRLRVGKYRIIYKYLERKEEKNIVVIVFIVDIGSRGNIYNN